MKDGVLLLDPTSERSAEKRARRAPLASLEGKTIALLDISKARGDVFLNRVEELFKQKGGSIKRYAKPTFTRVAPINLRQEIAANCHAVIEALAD